MLIIIDKIIWTKKVNFQVTKYLMEREINRNRIHIHIFVIVSCRSDNSTNSNRNNLGKSIDRLKQKQEKR